MNRYGTMKRTIHLLGTALMLEEGERVHLTPATNIPGGGYFARPLRGKWCDGITRNLEDSIHLTADELAEDVALD